MLHRTDILSSDLPLGEREREVGREQQEEISMWIYRTNRA
jgi:hypothetical protein